jgi:Icc-related predicted phosphoesterase
MIIDCISDLHGHYPKLEGGDLLIVAGDLTRADTIYEHADFLGWLNLQEYKKKVFIAGNHDNNVDNSFEWGDSIGYLRDSGTEFEGLKIWGSPWTARFAGMNPKCMAFTTDALDEMDAEEELQKKWDLIPEDTHILVTHCPPFAYMDEVKDYTSGKIINVGSFGLQHAILNRLPNLRLHVFGHIHEGHGMNHVFGASDNHVTLVNASYVNEYYKPVNKPIRIII